MATDQVTTPSSMIATVRGMKMRELNILADKSRAVRLETFDDILAACVENIDDPGALGEKFTDANGKVDWSQVTIGDRFTLLVHIRVNTSRLGPKYKFRHKCTSCGETYDNEITILEDLEFQPYSEDDLDVIKNGESFTGSLLDGREFTWNVLTGKDEKRAAKKARRARSQADKSGRGGLISVAISERLKSLDGKTNKRQILEMIEDLPDEEFDNIIEQLDAHDGGFDDQVEVECPECGEFEDHKVPFAGDFWMSQRKPKKKAARVG